MSTRKSYKIFIFTFFMIMINYMGRVLATRLSLPVWLDSFGTALTAYIIDPFCGAVVGLAGNLIYGIKDSVSLFYGVTSIAIGIIVGIAARKGLFETVFGTLTASVIVTLFSVLISTPINILTNDGMVGNMWGDGVVSYLLERDIHPYLASAVGEFYVDFLDKVITMLALFVTIKIVRLRRNRMTATVMIPIIILPLFAFGISMPVRADETDVNNNNIQVVYSSDNGLPCGEANDVAMTNDGILWVGTYAGLYRYNGSAFKWMSDYDSVRNVNCLYVDEEGRLWIGTNDNGFSIAINEKVTNVIDESKGLPSNSVRCITMSSDGDYYIGTSSSLQIMTLNGGLDFVKEIPEIVYAHSIDSDAEGNVAAVTNDGKLFLVNSGEIVTSMESKKEQEIFTCAAFDSSGMLYVGTSSNGVYFYKITEKGLEIKGHYYCGQLSNINRLFFNDEGIMYVCADNGIGYLDAHNNFRFINTGSFNNSIDNMTVDYQGNLWFSSSRLGVLKLTASGFTDIYRSAGIEGKVVNSVTIWKDNLYVGTDNGLDIIDMQRKRQVQNDLTKMFAEVRIRCVIVDSKDNLWICTYGKGLFMIDKGGNVETFDSMTAGFGDWCRSSFELSDGTIAASCETGLGIFENGKLKTLFKNEEGLSQSMILCITQLSDGRVLCGTDGDGIAIIKDDKITGHYTNENGLSSDVILRIVEDPIEQGAYIVTSNGLCYMDKNDHISFLNKFPYFNNYDIWPRDDGELFVLGSAGIYVTNRDEIIKDKNKDNPETEKDSEEDDVEFELLDSKRGLKAALTANSWDYLDEEGNLYLSSDNGVFKMNLNDYGDTRKSYRMMISSVELDGEAHEIERGETFYVGRDVSKVEIMPEVVNYTTADPFVCYYLEGFDTKETVVPQSELSGIVYTNIPSGEYRFHLSVLDSKSQKVLEEGIYIIEKGSEIHDTRWFHIYMLLVGMLAVSWFTWFIARTQIQRTLNFQKKELEYARKQVQMGNETILAIAKTVDAKDSNTSQHSQRVSEYSVLIARELGFTEDQCENIKQVALLHDIGKIGIPDKVLNKPGRLTDDEYAIMKSHVTRGAKILKDFTVIDHVIEGALYHHERYDGTGYPQGLSGESIPLYGRIIGVADAFDAMTANRVYRKKLDIDYVLNELRTCSGTQFDPKIVDIMLKLIDEKVIDISALYGDKKEDGNEES